VGDGDGGAVGHGALLLGDGAHSWRVNSLSLMNRFNMRH
jgi:hypothetical protein